MAEQSKQRNPLVAVLISAIVVAIIVVWAMVKPKSNEPINQGQFNLQDYNQPVGEPALTTPPTEGLRADSGLRPGLRGVINAAKTWGPAFELWFGRPAPGFALTDLTGRQHRLSEYRGRNVIIVFWATWCGPCRMEIPHLIELRNTIGEDKLAILAISNEDPILLAKFIAQHKINYTVFSNKESLPTPFNLVNAIPCSFFIDPQGRIKLATVGMLSLDDIKAILQA
jgi:peroxiredoxin